MKVFARKPAATIAEEIPNILMAKIPFQADAAETALDSTNRKAAVQANLTQLLISQNYTEFLAQTIPLIQSLGEDECDLTSFRQLRLSFHLFRVRTDRPGRQIRPDPGPRRRGRKSDPIPRFQARSVS